MGPPDLGPPDLGPPDLGPPDLGPPDLGPPDMGCGMPEVCNGLDDDCDGAVDENPGGPRGENACDACTRTVSPGGVTYQVCEFSISWSDGRTLCRAAGYQLASPETAAEDSFLDGQLLGGQDYWIGLNDLASEGTFVWSDQPADRPLSGFTDWQSGEPNDAPGGADCVRIDRSSNQWRDSDCTGAVQDSNFVACEAP
ncbi:MAG: hypothetical protein CMN30_00845 [Sandaracinus sp.]|nr:hypothetical protein [Sandaracinus sp.]